MTASDKSLRGSKPIFVLGIGNDYIHELRTFRSEG